MGRLSENKDFVGNEVFFEGRRLDLPIYRHPGKWEGYWISKGSKITK